MKKNTSAVAAIIISSCLLSGCPNKPNIISNDAAITYDGSHMVDVQVEKQIEEVIVRDNWEIAFPISWSEKKVHDYDVNLLLINDLNQSLLTLKISEYKGSYNQLAINMIRDYRSQSIKLISINSIELNNQVFLELKSQHNDISSITWMTVINNQSYIIDCGGLSSNEILVTDCNKIFSSLKLY